jgi:hypothetical protein
LGGRAYIELAGIVETAISRLGHRWEEGKAHREKDGELHIGEYLDTEC